MHAIPMPDDFLPGHPRTVIGEPGDPTRLDVRPAEYAITASELYPGRPRCWVVVDLEDDERAAIAAGARVVLSMDGGELPWSLDVLP